MAELKPCPFCGGEARICAKHFTDGEAYAWIECGCCHAKSRYSDSIEDLNLAWNARADDYHAAADYWKRMYEETVRERTCHDKGGIGTKFPATFICSECGWYSPPFAFGEGMPCYCPNCGARVEVD